MNVLHVLPTVASRYGGTSTFIRSFCRASLSYPGLSVEVAATDADGDARFNPTEWDMAGVPLHLFQRAKGKVSFSPDLSPWLFKNLDRYDLVHIHSSWNGVVCAANRAAVANRKPIVLSPHGMLSRYSWSRQRLLKWAYWWWRERRNVRTASALHCTTEEEAEEIHSRFKLPCPIRVVPLGVDPEAWSVAPDRDAIRRLCGPAAGNLPILLFLSRLHPKKGVTDLLLPAFAQLERPAFLAVAGGVTNTDDDYLKQIRRTISRLGLKDRVSLLGSIPFAERWQLFDGAAAFVLPSHQENFGLVVAEAMARGTRVVISDQVQIAPWVRKAVAGGEVVVRDVSQLAASIERVLRRTVEHPEDVAAAREFAKVNFDWTNTVAKITDLYRSLL